MEKDRIYLYHRISSTKTLGPGERYVLWLQGCIHNCKGCVAPETHSLDSGGYWIEIDEIIEEMFNAADAHLGIIDFAREHLRDDRVPGNPSGYPPAARVVVEPDAEEDRDRDPADAHVVEFAIASACRSVAHR
mgnify:CR=1 FL=1